MTPAFQVNDDAQTPEILSVAQLNNAVARLLDASLPPTWVRGEISNFTAAASGHWYFTLKDARATVRSVMFRGRASTVGFTPRVGDRVDIRARVSLYEPRGDYQLQVDAMRRSGQGDLYEQFLRLKEKLTEQGLFEPERKRPIAAIPRVVGVITSLQAAALRDVLTALQRRAPHVRVVIYPAPVQGAEAPGRLIDALAQANRRVEADTILLVRGGGSIEDLWAFNDEGLALAISQSAIPVISGVGHETDFTIADFIADLRAPTPTAAAELACTDRRVLVEQLNQVTHAMRRAQQRGLEYAAQRLDRMAARLTSPGERLAQRRERLTVLNRRLAQAWHRPDGQRQSRLALALQRLRHRTPQCDRARDRLIDAMQRLARAQQREVADRAKRLQGAVAHLRAFDPQNTLARGYAIVRDASGAIVRDGGALKKGQALALQLGQGSVDVKVVTPNGGDGATEAAPDALPPSSGTTHPLF